MPYTHLLSPLRVGGLTLPNRIVMGAMHTRLETLDRPLERLAAFYAQRAAGETGLILTGGFAPEPAGIMEPGGPLFDAEAQIAEHRPITQAVRQAGGHIALQILHAGRYARVPECVAPSAVKARINAFTPRALSNVEVRAVVAAFARTARLAERAGYVGAEIMGSEGYLLNEFTAPLTNRRDDEYGGDLAGRLRFPVDVVKAVRAAVSPGFVVIYRISCIDLVDGGTTADEIAALARAVEAAGADVINTGIGWHEAAVPTIAASVPRAAWLAAIRNVKRAVGIPVMASNRIGAPQVAEDIIASGAADLVSMARPLLADPDFARKTRLDRAAEIVPCIACNQSCLDRIFTQRTATCLVNPRAGREIELTRSNARSRRRVAVVGGGAAGMAFALEAAERGHGVTLFEAGDALGGQLNLAKRVPGKSEFEELLRYYRAALARAGVDVRLGVRATVDGLASGRYDDVVLATGVHARALAIPGADHPKVVGYADVLSGKVVAGPSVAVVGAGGIGFDVAEFLVGDPATSLDPEAFAREWGVDLAIGSRGGVVPAAPALPGRSVFLLQRRQAAFGQSLGRSTGWILKARLRRAGVATLGGVTYDSIDDVGLNYSVSGERRVLAVDHIVVCAGQLENRDLQGPLARAGIHAHLVGGANAAAELDAARAIEEAVRLAARI